MRDDPVAEQAVIAALVVIGMLTALAGALFLAVCRMAADLEVERADNDELRSRLREAKAARMDLLMVIDRLAGSAAVLRRDRDRVLETAAGVAKLAQLDALRASNGPPSS